MNSDFWYESVGPAEWRAEQERPKLQAMTASEQLSHYLKDYRKTWRMSQAQLARKSGTTQRVISLIEAGKYNPSLDLVQRLAEACSMRVVLMWQRK